MTLPHVDHCCAVCESDCDTVTALKRRLWAAEHNVQALAFALTRLRELRDFALEEIDRRFPEEPAA